MYHWEKLINLKLFYNTYNNIINLIRDNSVNVNLLILIIHQQKVKKIIEINKLNLKILKSLRI